MIQKYCSTFALNFMPTSPHICILCFCPLLLQNSFKAHIPTHQHSDSLSTRAHPPTPSLFFVLIILLSTSSAFVALYYHASLLPCLPTTMPSLLLTHWGGAPHVPQCYIRSTCHMLYAPCYTHHVVCRMYHNVIYAARALCYTHHVIRTMLYTPCYMHHVICTMLYTPCYTHHVIRTMLYTPCYTHHVPYVIYAPRALCYIRTKCLILYTHHVPFF